MDPVPLIPKSNQLKNHDTSHILREVFQDIISAPEFSKNVAENTEKYNVENLNLKDNGSRVISAYNGTKLCMQDIGFVEDKLMVGQGKFMNEKDFINKDEILTEWLKLKRKGVFLDLDLNEAKKYGLLQKIDLLPSKPERSMDFRINSNRHRCPSPCLSRELDIYPTKLEGSERKRKHQKIKHKITEKRIQIIEKREVIFKADPETVYFEDYKIGIVYEQNFKLRNISKTTQAFIPRVLPKTSFFKVELQTGSTRVAPGMCAIFCVKYKTDTYKDVEETMIFNTYTGQDVEVKLKSWRSPPNLLAFVYRNVNHFTEKFVLIEGLYLHNRGRAVALNSTIDCGSCLLGNTLNLNLILKNEGSIGRFFILSEDDWYFADVSAVNKGLELMTKTFHIYPTYFEIDTDEFVELDITFFPVNYGLEVEKLFLLCDNNTLEELEIVGDGVLLELNSVVIEAQRKHQNMNDMDADSGYFLNFGKCIPYDERICIFTIHNNSLVDLNYKWEIRESVCHIKGTKLKKMNPSWVTINQKSNSLPAQSTTDFSMKIQCITETPGLYSLVFTLYVLDIPEACLAEEPKAFYAIEGSQTSTMDDLEPKLVNVVAGEVEVICDIIPVHIQLDPENIKIPNRMDYEDEFTQKVQVYTAGPAQLYCAWVPAKTNCIEVYPAEFILNPKSTFICDITIHIYTYEDVEDTLILLVNDGLYRKEYNITAKVVKPVAHFSENLLNFGYVPKGKKINCKNFYVENIGKEKVYWEIFEFYFDHEHNTICELNASEHLSITSGILEKNESCALSYTIDNCSQHHRWLSFLILLSSHPTIEAMDSLCLITYEVTQPEIIIHTSSSQQPILYPGKLLYIGFATFYMVCLHNIGSKLPASFIWGKPVGKHADSIQITCSPKAGIVQPQKCVHITISLMPLETGILDEIYVPCFVGNLDEPIMLTVLCVVDNICLFFHLPDEEGRLEKVFWPPKIISDFEGFSLLELDHFESEAEEENTGRNSELYKKLATLQSTQRSCLEQHSTSCRDTLTEIREETIPLETLQPEEETDYELHLSLESSVSSMYSLEKSSSLITPSAVPLKDYFGSDLILQDHLLEYRDVPLRTPVKKTIIIENLTPIHGNFTVEATNFYALDKERNIMNDILVKLNIKKKDEWEESINNDFGIVVKTVPGKGAIGPNKSIEIDLWVYANTWGTYMEEILIEVNEVVPFCFNLLIQVVGVPIEFPIALNSIANEPILRFGNIPYLSKPLKRNLKVTNTGCVPLRLTWHVFIPKHILIKKCLEKEKESFDDVVEVFYPSRDNSGVDETTPKSMTTPECCGIEDNTTFEIEPQVININPKSTETITITINTNRFKAKFIKTEIEANLIGHVYLAEEFTLQSNVYSRQADIAIPSTKVKLLATLELPLLKLQLVKGDTRIKAYANDIIEAQEICYEKVLVFKNVDSAPAIVYMHTISPFRVVSLQTAQGNTDKNATAAVVQPGECVEVLLECVIDAEEVLQHSDMLFNEKTSIFPEIPDFKNHSITLLRYLNIHQQGLKKQITALEFVIFYPELRVSHSFIDFGVVFVRNTKKMLLTLTNTTGSHLPFTVHKPTTSTAVIITPNIGIIPKATGTTPTSVILSLYFIPSESKVYQETVRILTNIPFYSFTVNLIGVGSNNEKFYVEGT